MDINRNKPGRNLTYKPPGPVAQKFLQSSDFVRGIMGPLGSGKSSACVLEVLRRSAEQQPSPDGIRYSRWAIIRNSYPELKTTTIKTWFQWVPQEFGKFTQDSPITHHIKAGGLDVEVYFMALDREEDAKKLLSLELTGAWINEAREINKGILDALTGRVGRYPAKNMGGCTWSGIIMDTNPPDDQSWWYKASEEERPNGWRFFKQPSGIAPDAENIENLPRDYYNRIQAGKDEDWIKVYVRGEYGFVTEGKAVFPMFKDNIHVAKTVIEPVPKLPLLLGADLGLTPASVVGQKLADGRWLIIDELTADQCGLIRFSHLLRQYIMSTYPDWRVQKAWHDPAGNQKAFSDEQTAHQILNNNTWPIWHPAPTNEFQPRREVVISALNRLVDGNPGVIISPKCQMLRKAMAGGYHFKFIKTGNGTQLHETPNKNQYSHIAEALQYLFLGGGEYSVALNLDQRSRTKRTSVARDVEYDIFNIFKR